MIKQILRNKLLIAMVLLLPFTVSYSSNAFAHGHGGHGGYGGHGHYYYRGGGWYGGGWWPWNWFAADLVVGTVVAGLPPYYDTVYVGGAPYYYSDDIYYRPGPSGYVVVPAPAAAAVVAAPNVTQPGAASGEAVVINIPNTNGGYTPVQLTKHKEGYVGPQGEYYDHPTVKQLKVLYGR
jgi:hypothetical protein